MFQCKERAVRIGRAQVNRDAAAGAAVAIHVIRAHVRFRLFAMPVLGTFLGWSVFVCLVFASGIAGFDSPRRRRSDICTPKISLSESASITEGCSVFFEFERGVLARLEERTVRCVLRFLRDGELCSALAR
jgi:hypothetical protein